MKPEETVLKNIIQKSSFKDVKSVLKKVLIASSKLFRFNQKSKIKVGIDNKSANWVSYKGNIVLK